MKLDSPNYINHFVLVLDASSSMNKHRQAVIEVVDNQIEFLAERSKALEQETRITVYTFASKDTAKCVIYDKDVLRMPGIAAYYKPDGMTALLDATHLAIDDMKLTPQKYGDHAIVIWVWTDGMENHSRKNDPNSLVAKINGLDNNWTLATFVPDKAAHEYAKRFGFPPGNISIWDATSAAGIADVAQQMRTTSENFMQARKSGVRSTKSLFQLKDVSPTDIVTQLTPVSPNTYSIYAVWADGRIDEFVELVRGHYSTGQAFYELMKTEEIQPQKDIAILYGGKLYRGANARTMLGLPNYSVRVKPSAHPGYKIFVQSTSQNRKLIAGTQCLVFN